MPSLRQTYDLHRLRLIYSRNFSVSDRRFLLWALRFVAVAHFEPLANCFGLGTCWCGMATELFLYDDDRIITCASPICNRSFDTFGAFYLTDLERFTTPSKAPKRHVRSQALSNTRIACRVVPAGDSLKESNAIEKKPRDPRLYSGCFQLPSFRYGFIASKRKSSSAICSSLSLNSETTGFSGTELFGP